MNKFIAEVIRYLNAFIGFAIIGVGVVGGTAVSVQDKTPWAFFAVVIVSILLATLVCGIIAMISDMRMLLREIRDRLGEPYKAAPTDAGRRQPT